MNIVQQVQSLWQAVCPVPDCGGSLWLIEICSVNCLVASTTGGASESSESLRIVTADLPLVILVSAVLTGLVSWVLLRLYRRTVLQSMAQRAAQMASAPLTQPTTLKSQSELPPIVLRWREAPSTISLSTEAELSWQQTRGLIRHAALVQAAAGAAYALVLSVPWMITVGDGFSVCRLLWLIGCYIWLPMMATMFVTAASCAGRLRFLAGYFIGMAGLFYWAHSRNAGITFCQMAFVWCFANVPAGFLFAIFLNRKVRAAGPLVLTFLVAGLSGVVLAMELALVSVSLQSVLAWFGAPLGLNAEAVVVLFGSAGFVLLGLLTMPVLRWIGRYYLAKRTSDQQLTLDAVWLLLAALQSFTFAFQGLGWIFTGPLAFVVYKMVGAAGRRWVLQKTRSAPAPPLLLLLRVFSLGKRSESLVGALNRRWLHAGPIAMIAGPDLATITAEPHEILAFLGGKLSRRFVKDRADLEQRVEGMDLARDPDGRYRVTEFFCHADTWQLVMQRLARDANVVLMDLRSFSPSNQGCLYELGQLLSLAHLESLVFLTDATTDRIFLEKTLVRLWQEIPDDSPNRASLCPEIQLLRLSASGTPDASLLLRCLFRAWKQG